MHVPPYLFGKWPIVWTKMFIYTLHVVKDNWKYIKYRWSSWTLAPRIFWLLMNQEQLWLMNGILTQGSVIILALRHSITNLSLQEILTISIGSPLLLTWAVLGYLAVRTSVHILSCAVYLKMKYLLFQFKKWQKTGILFLYGNKGIKRQWKLLCLPEYLYRRLEIERIMQKTF